MILFSSTSDNSKHTATLWSAQIRQSRTWYVRLPLSEMPDTPKLRIGNKNNGIGISK